MPQSTHDSVPALDEQLRTLIETDWQHEVLAQLPATYEQPARELKAFRRARGLRSAGDLLRGLVAFVLWARSLRELGAWATLIGLGHLSHVAWRNRLRGAAPFLLWLLAELLAVPVPPAPSPMPRIVLVDGTRLKEPGGCGDDWRVPLGYDVMAGRVLHVKVSDRHTAEALSLFPCQAGDRIVADRGYCGRAQLAVASRAGARYLVRLAPHQVPLRDAQGEPVAVVNWLNACGAGHHSMSVSFEYDGQRFAGRLIACSFPPEVAECARAKERKKNQQRQVQEDTLYVCGWLLLLSTCSPQDWSDAQLLELYRARWQIELAIKSLKQLLPLVQWRGQTAATNEATLLALLVATALQQNVASQMRQQLSQALSQWSQQHLATASASVSDATSAASVPNAASVPDAPSARSQLSISSWTLRSLSVQTLCQVVQGYWNVQRLSACLPWLGRYLCHRRKRPHQESTIRSQVLTRFAPAASETSLLLFCSSAYVNAYGGNPLRLPWPGVIQSSAACG